MAQLFHLKQAGVLPYQIIENQIWILLITARASKSWIIPKGNIEATLSARDSAEKEAFEEAGIIGKLHFRSAGAYSYQKSAAKGGKWHRVRVYPMEITKMFDDYPERKQRKRKLLPLEKALSRVDNEELRTLIASFAAQLMKKAEA